MAKVKKKLTIQSEVTEDKQKIRMLNIFLLHYFNLIVLFLVILVLAIGFFYLIKPKYKSISWEIKLTDQVRETEYNSLQQYYTRLKQYKLSYDKINEKDIKRIENMTLTSSNYEELFRELETVILKRGLLLTFLEINLDVLESSPRKIIPKSQKIDAGLPDGIGKIRISMEIIGVDYKSFKGLLATIENNLRLLDIEELTFSPAEKTVSFEINAYYLIGDS